ncbi:urease accessory protein UreE [uncultured Paraglaciecola sp.]|jgi:urease accessory protein|uniref:urease accessory protein UreE n=1 Tax=uncultured Paraglaciecola sp. TaxID=1765024 RepID=UPI0025D0CD42|nr:urease accessory protein UreE [uncultured Paraglaciecola sp.]
MLQAFERLSQSHETSHNTIHDSVTLDQDTRKKARIKISTDQGQTLGVFMQRGHPLLVGEVLKTECGLLIEVKGKAEEVSTAIATNWMDFSRICYHLGNRHTSLQIGELWVRFKPDHVLEELAENYGLSIDRTAAVFEPENGAYGSQKHGHGHIHSHSHD